jgi:hypothetical protein
MARRPVMSLLLVLVCLLPVRAFAQDQAPGDPPAHIAFVDGSVVLERDGRTDRDPLSMPLVSGDRLRTEEGRVEVLFNDGSALHLDTGTVVDFQSDAVIRLLEGRIRLAIAGSSRDIAYRVDAPSAWVQINDPGEYRIGILRNADVELAVLRGAAELVNEDGRSYIRAGERTFAREGSAPSPPYVFNSAAWDDFDRWSELRRDRRLGISAQYLPRDIYPYASTFDAHGAWRYEQAYGYVWFPRVAVGWRPYHHGRWVRLRPYGWTWIAADPWGWPTHHYGRWGLSAGSWFWIPDRRWGPAWVSWAYATDYVSWCPLGWNNRPVLQIVNVNVFNGRRYDPWDAWTVLPRRHFSGGYVNVASFRSVRVDRRVHDAFVVRDSGPETGYALDRSPIRSAGRFTSPRPGGGALPGAGGRAIAGGNEAGGERRLPAPARPSRAPSAIDSSSGVSSATPSGSRAITRERGAMPADPGGSRAVISGRSRELESREPADSAAGGTRRRGGIDDSTAPPRVTDAPTGAVRAVPRVRQPADNPAGSSRVSPVPDRARTREDRAPANTAPPAGTGTAPAYPPAARPSSERGVDRSSPGPRSAPDTGGDYRGRAVPRSEAPAPPPPPAYRPGPERRPSGPPPAAAAPSSGGNERSGGSERSSEGGNSRRPSAGASSSGQGARRRR